MSLRWIVLFAVVCVSGFQMEALADQAFLLAELSASDRLPPKTRLGEKLFFDKSLSEPAGQSCATCHDPKSALTDPDRKAPTSAGVIKGLFGNRNTPTAAYAAFSPYFHYDTEEGLFLGGQFLDGRMPTLETQAMQPLLNPVEMANPNKAAVVSKVQHSSYAPMFLNVFGQDAFEDVDKAYEYIAEAIAEFERSPLLNPFTSKYDAWLAGKARLSPQERRGLELFEREDKGNCAACHPSRPADDGTPPLFTDFSYDNLGVPRNPDNPFYRLSAFNPEGWKWVDRGLGGSLNNSSEYGKFKVPTLRNIAVTGPYTHNGYLSTLRNVVAFYNSRDTKPACPNVFTAETTALKKGCWPKPEVTENVNVDELGNLGLTDEEVNDIVAFLKTLTDGYRLPTPPWIEEPTRIRRD